MNIREFNDIDISEINKYVASQVPLSILPQMFILTEEPIKKIQIFISIYRTIEGARDFVETEQTRSKLNEFLDEGKAAYNEIYPLFLKYDASSIFYGKEYLFKNLVDCMIKHNSAINKFTNNFIVFAEKLELISTDTVAGIKLDKFEGVELVRKAQGLVED